jgi:hypothetical protein
MEQYIMLYEGYINEGKSKPGVISIKDWQRMLELVTT